MKKCTCCEKKFPHSRFYKKANGKPHGACKECMKHERRERYRENPDPHRDRVKKYREKNKTEINARLKARRHAKKAEDL